MPGRSPLAYLVAALGVFLTLGAANAHQTSLARATVDVAADRVSFTVTVSAHDLAVAVGLPTDLRTPIPAHELERAESRIEAYIRSGLTAHFDGAACERLFILGLAGLPETVTLRTEWSCDRGVATLRFEYRLFFEIDPAHRALGEINAEGRTPEEFLIDAGFTSLVIDNASALVNEPRTGFLGIVGLGFEHILIGLDHILFLIVLIVATPAAWPLVKTVTAFTLGHSITLALAWFDVFALPASIVEPIIALSIVFVAVENLVRIRPAHRRWIVASCFGLVHGLGFYNVLNALDVAGGSALLTLVGFNIGVELGQLLIVAASLPILLLFRDRVAYGPAMKTLSAIAGCVALYWVVERVVL